MSFNTNWDVDKYKTEYESEEQWELRRLFMVTHQEKFPEERLVCLAQVFTNVEFLGCRYPSETMQLVEQLSEGVADDYREKQKSKLQRTFVKASDAAGAKVKGLKRPAPDDSTTVNSPPKICKRTDNPEASERPPGWSVRLLVTNKPDLSESAEHFSSSHSASQNSELSVSKEIKFVPSDKIQKITSECVEEKSHKEKKINRCELELSGTNVVNSDTRILKKEVGKLPSDKAVTVKFNETYEEHIRHIDAKKFGKLILIDNLVPMSPIDLLTRSTTLCKIPFKINYDKEKGNVLCKVFVNGHLLTSCYGANTKDARCNAVNEAYEKLKQICYVLKIKSKYLTEDPVVEKFDNLQNQVTSNNNMDKPLGEENVGSKLMRAMGWTGGGLGKEQQGIEEPINVEQRIYRSGLGLDSGMASFDKNMFPLLKDYARKNTIYSLVFSSDFSKEERAQLHSMAKRLGLLSRSYGKNSKRRLVVSKRKNYCRIVEDMLRTGKYSTPFYELRKPPISLASISNSQLNYASNIKSENLVADSRFLHKESEVLKVSQPEKEESCKVMETSFKNEGTSLGKNSNFKVEEFQEENDKKLPLEPSINKDICAEPYGLLVLLEDENCFMPIQIIERSANACHVPFKLEYNSSKEGMVCKLYVNNVLVTSNTETSKKKARELSVSYGLKELKDKCYSLKNQMKIDDNWLKVTKILKKPNSSRYCDSSPNSEIICHSKELNWQSLGLKAREDVSQADFKNRINYFLRKYLSEISPFDLVVPPDFSAQELANIQQIASNMGLKVTKYHLAQKDFLVIKKKLSLIEITRALLNSGGSDSSNSLDISNAVVI